MNLFLLFGLVHLSCVGFLCVRLIAAQNQGEYDVNAQRIYVKLNICGIFNKRYRYGESETALGSSVGATAVGKGP